jgi:hypothetical protein
MVTTSTDPAWLTFSRSGNSPLHGPHELAQKLIRVGLCPSSKPDVPAIGSDALHPVGPRQSSNQQASPLKAQRLLTVES